VQRTLIQMHRMVSIGSVEVGDALVSPKDVACYQQMSKDLLLIRAVVEALDSVNLRMFFGKEGKAFVKQNRLGAQLINFGLLCHVFLQASSCSRFFFWFFYQLLTNPEA